jgi:16S rRNA processing protein RimM
MTDTGQTIIPVGYVRKAHGIRGDVVVRGLLEDAHQRLVPGAAFETNEGTPRMVTITSVNQSGADLRLHFAGVDSRDDAEELKGVQLMIDAADRRVLTDGEWWPEDLVGCSAVDALGVPIGEVVQVIIGGVQDRLVVVRLDGERAEVPFVEALVPTVDIEAQIVRLDLPIGLFD